MLYQRISQPRFLIFCTLVVIYDAKFFTEVNIIAHLRICIILLLPIERQFVAKFSLFTADLSLPLGKL